MIRLRPQTIACLASLLLLTLAFGISEARSGPPTRRALVFTKTGTQVCSKSTPAGSIWNVTTTAGQAAGVFVEAGCPQDTTWNVKTCTDGGHVHAGAGGTVAVPLRINVNVTWTGRCGRVHQDGVQVMGGHNIRAKVTTGGVFSAGSNGAWFIDEGAGHNERPSNVICDHCVLHSHNTGAVISGSINSGVTNSTLQGDSNGCLRVSKKTGFRQAVTPVIRNNVCKAGP